MRTRFVSTLLLAAIWIGHSTGIAQAQVGNPLITVDEHGKGSLLFPGGAPFPTVGVLAPDPGPGGLASALTYNLLGPPGLIAGDVHLIEPGTRDTLSEIIRFNPAGTGSPAYPASLVFYSDNADGVDALADTGFPTGAYTNIVTLLEVGPEGSNGAFYTPGPDQPGFVAGFAVTYHFISDDAVPEPGAAVMLLAGAPVIGAYMLRRRKR
jgi:hypothetical protein